MAILFAAVIALIHVYAFYLESVAWGRPTTNKLFHVSAADAAQMKKMAFNQGFYNLFLAAAILLGFALKLSHREIEGNTLIDYAAVSVFGAGFVLYITGPEGRRGAMIQALPAMGYLGFRMLGY
jgi:putative membrane protein